jgi:hypothetical protein
MKIPLIASLYIRKAQQDLMVLGKWRQDPDIAEEIIGFHAQQAAEKMLKSILAYYRFEIPRTHRLADLLDLIMEKRIDFPVKFEELRFLTPFAVEYRYDFIGESSAPLEIENTLILLNELHQWIFQEFQP